MITPTCFVNSLEENRLHLLRLFAMKHLGYDTIIHYNI